MRDYVSLAQNQVFTSYGRNGYYGPRQPQAEHRARRDSHQRENRGRSGRRDSASPVRQQENRGRSARRDSTSPVRRRSSSMTPDFRPSRKRIHEGPAQPQDLRHSRARLQPPSGAGYRRRDTIPGVVLGFSDKAKTSVQGFSDNTSAKGFERLRKRILGSLSAPFYGGPSPGPLTEANCSVFLEEKIRSVFRTLESGVVKLEPDEMVDGVWTTLKPISTPRVA